MICACYVAFPRRMRVVGFFNRRDKAAASPATAEEAEVPFWGDEDGIYAEKVVGESHYQVELSELAKGLEAQFPNGARMKFTAVLVCEADNKYDANAIYVAPVVDGATGSRVGYLAKERAAALSPKVRRAGGIIACYAALIGGGVTDDGGAKSWGVVLDLGSN